MAENTAFEEIVVTRVFDAPRELVWKAFTEPERIARWWGPRTFTIPTYNIDLRVGGKYHYCMRSPEGQDVWATGVYREIVPIERLVFTDNFADEHGNVVNYPEFGDWSKALITFTFEDEGGKTKMTLRHTGLPVGDMAAESKAGWNESFDKLAESLK